MAELEALMEKDSTPLRPIGDAGPPSIIRIDENYSAIEGEYFSAFSSWHLIEF